MGLFDIFRRSKRQVIKENAAKGKNAERRVKAEYEMKGYEVERTGKGHDFKVTKKNWLTGKKETKYVEVKTGNAELSPLQKKKKRSLGGKYKVERRDSTSLGGMIGNLVGGTKSTKRKSSGGLLGGGTKSTKRKSSGGLLGGGTKSTKRKSSGGLLGGGTKSTKRKSSGGLLGGGTKSTKRKSSGGLLGGGTGRSRRTKGLF